LFGAALAIPYVVHAAPSVALAASVALFSAALEQVVSQALSSQVQLYLH
jgi:hypothetical protein